MKRLLKLIELAIRRVTLAGLKRMGGNRSATGAALTLPRNPKILFLRQDRIGDAIVTTPLLVAVANAYPQAEITMLLGSNNASIAPLLPVACRTVVYSKRLVQDFAMLRRLRREAIDVLIDLTDNASVTSSMLVALIKPRVAIGIEKENAVVYDVLVPRIDREEHHISRRIAELLRPLDIACDGIDLRPRLNVEKRTSVSGRLGINISAGTESRRAPAEVYAEIARRAIGQGWVDEVRVFCEPKDSLRAKEVVELAGHPRVIQQPPTPSFGAFATELSTCSVLITPDTSVVHLAAALKIPQVVIYAPIPEGLHYWTPVGVPYEMMVQRPSLAELEPAPVVELLRTLTSRLAQQEHSAQ